MNKPTIGSRKRSRPVSRPSKPSASPATASSDTSSTDVATTIRLHEDWNEFLSLLTRHGVRFLLVGGYAVAANGYPRYTQDLDVFVDTKTANAKRLVKALGDFGYPTSRDAWREFAKPNKILFIGVLPFRIDVLTSISGVSFAEAWKGRIVARTETFSVPAIGLEALIKNKLASGRPNDLRDVESLNELKAYTPKTTPKRGTVLGSRGKKT